MVSTTAEYKLYDGINTENKLFRVRKEWVIHFTLDASLVGKNVRFFTNYPEVRSPCFNRTRFRELHIVNPTISRCPQDTFDNYFEIRPLIVSGSFQFYFSTDGSDLSSSLEASKIAGQGYFIVDPRFTGSYESADGGGRKINRSWDLDGVVLQTYLAKNMGLFSQWPDRVKHARMANYNMLHFTPLQELGYSRSAYSLRDQLRVNPEFSPKGCEKPVDWADIEKFVKFLENEWSTLSMTDLVFNHTSNDSKWLHEHPECGYNVVNSPHLAGAYILDRIVCRLTQEAEAGRLRSVGIPECLSNASAESGAVRSWLYGEIEKARVHEFYQADIDAVCSEFCEWLCKFTFRFESSTYAARSTILIITDTKII
ncbi:unnamed protein product [Protopolystoma xenopodis]|uniref:Glycogen debranching enzyme glucanotransferase domain-containing protein n=1 Tax=Protopolystoma xenopodis TaxID=117903 RepID=A0A448X1U5_9PLAT|nr:unnamed protein product [Protopolystoma xenopodis]